MVNTNCLNIYSVFLLADQFKVLIKTYMHPQQVIKWLHYH